MPYRYGHYAVGICLIVTILGFWPSYFLKIGANIPWAFHTHAFTATSWLLLLIVQSVAIHTRNNALHRLLGKASFVLFPLLIMGFVSIINLSAHRYAMQESPFIMEIGPAFGLGMSTAIVAYLYLYYNALKHRSNVKLHSAYLLATPVILFESPFGRVIDLYIPWLNVIDSEGFQGVLDTIMISDAMMIVLALWLYLRDRRHGTPWLATMVFLALQMVLMWYASDIPGATAGFDLYARIPPGVTLALGGVVGAAAAWFGWQHGQRRRRSDRFAQPA